MCQLHNKMFIVRRKENNSLHLNIFKFCSQLGLSGKFVVRISFGRNCKLVIDPQEDCILCWLKLNVNLFHILIECLINEMRLFRKLRGFHKVIVINCSTLFVKKNLLPQISLQYAYWKDVIFSNTLWHHTDILSQNWQHKGGSYRTTTSHSSDTCFFRFFTERNYNVLL